MKLTFYSHYGVGDLFESREFVLDWMKLCGVETAQYAHRRVPGLFADLPQLESVDVRPEMDMRASITRQPDGLWVNTWVGRDSGYVVNPGVGCVVEQLYRMHNDMLREAFLPPLPRTMVDYLPVVDYSKIHLGSVLPPWLLEHNGKKIVLLCNGKTGSGHASNFPFEPMFEYLPEREDVIYVLTAMPYALLERPDVFWTDHLTGRRIGHDDCDLNQISLLSRFCTVLAGRCSGPHDFCMVRPNWEDATKRLVCFTQHRNGACFVLEPEKLGLKMPVIWSPTDNAEEAASIIQLALA